MNQPEPSVGIYLSFDLDLHSDYEGLYKWLDKNQAVQCGSRFLARVDFRLQKTDYEVSELIEEIKRSIFELFTPQNGDSLYLIFPNPNGGMLGGYLYGSKRTAPWIGFYSFNESGFDLSEFKPAS